MRKRLGLGNAGFDAERWQENIEKKIRIARHWKGVGACVCRIRRHEKNDFISQWHGSATLRQPGSISGGASQVKAFAFSESLEEGKPMVAGVSAFIIISHLDCVVWKPRRFGLQLRLGRAIQAEVFAFD